MCGVENCRQFLFPRAMFRRFAGQIHLDEQFQCATRLGRRFVDFLEQGRVVDRVNHVEEGGGLPGFIRLQVTDEMPGDGEIRGLRSFLLSFLDLVLAEVDLSGLCRGAHPARVEGFRDGDDTDAGDVAAGPGGGARDTVAHVRQPATEIVH